VHRVITLIEKTLEKKQVCSSLFLDVAQAFDKVWHEGLCHKIELLLPPFSQLLQSYLCDQYFGDRQEDEYSGLKPIKAGVTQESVLGPVLYLIYTSNLPQPEGSTVATIADDTAIMAVGDDVEDATDKLQQAANKINNWTKQWLIKLNEDKSIHVNLTSERCRHILITMNGKTVPYFHTAKYLGMTLDAKLHWKVHVKKMGRAWPKIQKNILAYG
jgi:hypothetical protein